MNTKEVLDYIMNTPYNTNWAVLRSIIGDNEELYKYITETPYNMNRAVLDGILDRIDNNEDQDALTYPYLLFDTSKNVTLSNIHIANNIIFKCLLGGISLTDKEKTAFENDVKAISVKIKLKNNETPVEATFAVRVKAGQQGNYILGDGNNQRLALPMSGSGNGEIAIDITPELVNVTSKDDLDEVQVIILNEVATVGTAVVGTAMVG